MPDAGTKKPVTLLIAAMGGEGGGVLMNWIVNAAIAKGFPVQATSVPGVAQRTGATTYYIELLPEASPAGAPRPVFSLNPVPGEVDLMIATELAEAARALSSGYITSDRTTLIASTHRVFLTLEKMDMGDGRLDGKKMLASLKKNAREAVLFDAMNASREAGAVINSVMLGAIAATNLLGISEDDFSDGIKAEGKAVAANLAGFDAGLRLAKSGAEPVLGEAAKRADRAVPLADLEGQAQAAFPAEAHAVLGHALRRLVDYQNIGYARRYLDRLAPFGTSDPELCREVARHLAVRMTFEDIIRVAQAKTRAERYARILGETGAGPADPVKVTEFFKPGFGELCDMLPPGLAKKVLAWAERTGRLGRTYWGMEIKTSTVSGFFRVWLLAKLRWWRPRSYRWATEQTLIDEWLELVDRARGIGPDFALEVAELARLIKGYGATHQRGSRNYRRIVETLVRPALEAGSASGGVAERVAEAREAALADSEGDRLAAVLRAGNDPVAHAAE